MVPLNSMLRKVKAELSKVKFSLGLSPEVEKVDAFRRFVPEPFSSVLLISADFELAWAWRYTKSSPDPLKLALDKAKKERENIPKILELCDFHDIPITWATVGHLFQESCKRERGIAHGDLPKLKSFENDYWRFNGDDWFEHDPCTNVIDDPEWYCPDLIRLILASSVKHEMACHTYSHIDCRDVVCSEEVMLSELARCKELASNFSVELKSFVHPGHTIGNLNALAASGFTNFRTDYRNVLGYPKKHSNGLWEIQQTAEFNYRHDWSRAYHTKRYKMLLDRAIQTHTVCVFWFHPSFDHSFVDHIWPELFNYINERRDKIWVTTHQNYISFLENGVI